MQYALDAKMVSESGVIARTHVAIGKTQSLSGKRPKGKWRSPKNIRKHLGNCVGQQMNNDMLKETAGKQCGLGGKERGNLGVGDPRKSNQGQ